MHDNEPDDSVWPLEPEELRDSAGEDDDFDDPDLCSEGIRPAALFDNLIEAHGVGKALTQLSYHFARIFALLGVGERRALAQHAYHIYQSTAPRIKNARQFLREVNQLLPELGGRDAEEDDAPDIRWSNEEIDCILAGNNSKALAQVLAVTTLSDTVGSPLIQAGIQELFSEALDKHILSPAQAAAIASCARQNELRVQAFEVDAEVLLADVYIYGRRFPDIVEAGSEFESDLPRYLERCSEVVKRQSSIVRPAALCGRFDLEEAQTGVFVPVRSRIVIARSLREALLAAERDRSTVMNMSPRRFEEFMASLFRGLGFEVELTTSTRDGGADLVCLRDLHGIPFRLAVELKRYKEGNRVNVSLIRSFVGANQKFGANRLLFVTTSDYTQPAIDWATAYAGCFLTLKKYEQIQEWCRDCLSQQRPRILGPDANMLAH